jgi:hypothetical protein
MIPTPEFQLSFIDYLQRLLDEGSFVASYKYALLMALADLSVEKGDNSGDALPLHARDIALKFIRYYSRQAQPFPTANDIDQNILHQNSGQQAALVGLVQEDPATYNAGGLQSIISRHQHNTALVNKATQTVTKMPLWKLQTIGREVDDFLYENRGKGCEFELKPGVAFCFRRFHGFIYRMAQDGWIRFIRERKQNQQLLGESTDLGQFMFGVDRSILKPYFNLLVDLQDDKCFYCGNSTKTKQVDHFIPWSWYSVDLGHNFVLSCNTCNSQKRDMLAAPHHLDKWLNRNTEFDIELKSYFEIKHLPHDLDISNYITRWAYDRVARSSGYTWSGGSDVEKIAADYLIGHK